MPLSIYEEMGGPSKPFKFILTVFDRETHYGEAWLQTTKPSERLYMAFEIGQSVGCEHYVTGCQIKCEICKQFFGCRRCHDDLVNDHQLPRYDTKDIKCLFCGAEQPFAMKCCECNEVLGNQTCDKCKYIQYFNEDATPLYHCDGCGSCNIGYAQFSIHCDQCALCLDSEFYQSHTCSRPTECIVCLQDLQDTKYRWFQLNCGHQLHEACYRILLHRGSFTCPVCRRFLPTQNDRLAVISYQEQIYQLSVLMENDMNNIITAQCNDCGKRFPQQQHPHNMYWCSTCKIFNSFVFDQNGTIEQFQQYIDEQKPEITPNLPSVDFIKNYFVKQIIERPNGETDQDILQQVVQIVGIPIEQKNLTLYCRFINFNHSGSMEELRLNATQFFTQLMQHIFDLPDV